MVVENRILNLEKSVEKLTKQIEGLVTRLSKVEETTKEEPIENKILDLREMICRVVIDGIYSYFYAIVYKDFGGKGFDTSEQAIYKANDLIARLGIVSVQTENYNRAFIYALNPSVLIDYDDGKLWDSLCDRVKNYKYHMTLAIGMFRFGESGESDENEYYGKYMNIAAREYCEKQDAKLRQFEDL